MALKGKVKESVEYIEKWMGDNPKGLLQFSQVRMAAKMKDPANFRTDIRRHPDFIDALADLGMVEHGNGRYAQGFMRAAEAFGFENEDGVEIAS